MNKVVLIGRLTKDPEIRYTPAGNAVSTFSIAVNRDYKNANGEYDTDFINCVAWNQTAEFMGNYLRKGYQIAVSGNIQTRNYQDQSGKTVYVTEVIVNQVQNLTPLEKKEEKPTEDDPFKNLMPSEDDIPF